MKPLVQISVALGLAFLSPECLCGAPPENHSLRVLTYNIHHGEGTDKKLDLARIARVINETRPDIVALQEVDQGVDRTNGADQPDELARMTKMHMVFGDNIRIGSGKYGNAILSRFPIEEYQNHRLPNREQGEQRGVLVAKINVPHTTRSLAFFATHLDHRRLDQERFESASAINAIAERHRDCDRVLAGDLNDIAGSRTLLELAKTWNLANEAPLPTIPVGVPARQIDFVLLGSSEDWKVERVEVLPESIASDHRALLAVIRLQSKPTETRSK